MNAVPIPRYARPSLARLGLAAAVAAVTAVSAAACSTSSPAKSDPSTSGGSGSGKTIQVVAAENFWGSIAAQLGGTHVTVTSIITNPDTDPHDYEPTAGRRPRDRRRAARDRQRHRLRPLGRRSCVAPTRPAAGRCSTSATGRPQGRRQPAPLVHARERRQVIDRDHRRLQEARPGGRRLLRRSGSSSSRQRPGPVQPARSDIKHSTPARRRRLGVHLRPAAPSASG